MMRRIASALGATALALAFATPAFAQAMPGGAANNMAPMATPANPHPMTPADVDPAVPFGALDIAAAGNTADTIRTFSEGLTEEQKVELTSRCQVIGENSANFQAEAVGFCDTWVQVMTADPGATPLPGLGGANPAGVPPAAPPG